MSQVPNYDDWKMLKDQLEELRHQPQSEPDIEETFDAQIRQRFGEMIARSAVEASKRRQR
jgi:hypothetical protein